MKKNLLVLAVLFVANATLATVFVNDTLEPVRVMGRNGIWYPVGLGLGNLSADIIPGQKGVSNSREFETGVQDRFVIELGREKVAPAARRVLRFNLAEIKRHFSGVNYADLLFLNGRHVLKVTGNLKGTNSADDIQRHCDQSQNCMVGSNNQGLKGTAFIVYVKNSGWVN